MPTTAKRTRRTPEQARQLIPDAADCYTSTGVQIGNAGCGLIYKETVASPTP